MKEVNDNNPKTKRYSIKCVGASMIIRPALVTEILQFNKRVLSVRYGSSRLFVQENKVEFERIVNECKEHERSNNL